MDKILWIEKGIAEASTYFTASKKSSEKVRMDEIVEESKTIGNGVERLVYVGYKNGNKVFEIYAGEGVTIMYDLGGDNSEL